MGAISRREGEAGDREGRGEGGGWREGRGGEGRGKKGIRGCKGRGRKRERRGGEGGVGRGEEKRTRVRRKGLERMGRRNVKRQGRRQGVCNNKRDKSERQLDKKGRRGKIPKLYTAATFHSSNSTPLLQYYCTLITHSSTLPRGRAAWWGNRMEQSCWQTISEHHVVINDMIECGELGSVINPVQTITLYTRNKVMGVKSGIFMQLPWQQVYMA